MSFEAGSRRRVVVTGAGLVSPLGLDRESSWQNLLAGESGVRNIRESHLEAGDPYNKVAASLGAPVVGFALIENNPVFNIRSVKNDIKDYDIGSQFFIEACHQAIMHARVPLLDTLRVDSSVIDTKRFGVAAGTGMGGSAVVSDIEKVLSSPEDSPRIRKFHILRGLVGRAGEVASMTYGAQASVEGDLSECAASAGAIAKAADEIVLGRADTMLAGGTETALHPAFVGMFDVLRALNRGTDPATASRPLHEEPGGLVMAQGAGALFLEERNHAIARGAPILAELAGWGKSADAGDPTFPDEDGIVRSIDQAYEWAGINIKDVTGGYGNLHCTSTDGDPKELNAWAMRYRPEQGYVQSTKGSTGHMFGSAGVAEAIFTILAMRDKVIPPAIVKGAISEAAKKWQMSFGEATTLDSPITVGHTRNSGFGGHNRDLIFVQP